MSNLSNLQKNFQLEMNKIELPSEQEILWMQADSLNKS